MNIVKTAVVAILFSVAVTATLLAEEPRPECSDETIGISCVVTHYAIGPWQLEEIMPPVGSQNTFVMFAESFQELPGLFNRQRRAKLVLSCIENKTRIEFRFGENFMSDIGEFGRLIYKLDDRAPVSIETTASQENDALGLYIGSPAIQLITELIGADRIFVSATAFTGRTLTASFQIEDLENAIVPFRELCNW